MRWTSLLTIAVVLAGCSDAAEPKPGPGEAAPPETDPDPTLPPGGNATGPDRLPWQIHDCFFVYSNALADADAVQDDMPEGFAVQLGQGGRVGVGFETNICASGTGLNGTVDDMQYATVWVGVTPPTHLASEEGAFHVVNFDTLIPDEDRQDWMQDRGMPARSGRVAVTEAGAGYVIDLDLGGVRHRLTIGQLQPVADSGGVFDQWTVGEETLSYWRTAWQTDGQFQAAGTIEVAQGSMYADWFDAAIVPATFNVGTWDYTDGHIEHPAPTV